MKQETIQKQKESGVLGDTDNPTLEEITQYIPKVIKHGLTVEHYLSKLGVKVEDGQHPHDLVGLGNKLEWEVIRGLALQKRDSEEKQRRYLNAIELHRIGQKHHQKWNNPNPEATPDDMKYGAIDAIVSLREARDYQGGVHSWGEIRKIIENNPEHKREWLYWALDRIKCLEKNEEGYNG
jgi:hypothetical protein